MRPRKLLRMAVAVATTLLLPSAHAFCPSGMAIRTRSSSQQLLWQVPSRAERQRQGTVTTATTARTHRQQLALFNSNNNDDNEVESAVLPVLTHDTPPQVYPQRWIQLSYLSALALISDWICFSVAATPGVYEQNFGHSAATIIDIFLFTNGTYMQGMTVCYCRGMALCMGGVFGTVAVPRCCRKCFAHL
jgi:hypothetical protein